MKGYKQLVDILKGIHAHPLASRHKLKSYYNFFNWQVQVFLSDKSRKVKFTDKSYLIAHKGMAGATGNIYAGLHEFEEMGFLLHLLRKDDLFYDIGANIGSYTVLASAHAGADSVCFEPVPQTYNHLKENLVINNIQGKVKAYNKGVGSKRGTLRFSSSLDTVNHVLPLYAKSEETDIEVDIVSIDECLADGPVPILIKIDVEGFETEVIAGMKNMLSDNKLKAVIIELNGSGARYGYNDDDIHTTFIKSGFEPYTYNPLQRKLIALKTHGDFNTIYLRDINFVSARIKEAEHIHIFSETF